MERNKANLTGDISSGILKGCVDSYIPILKKILNTSLERGCFPNQVKKERKLVKLRKLSPC